MHHIRMLASAARELEGLDKPVGRRIVKRIHWLAANLDNVRLIELSIVIGVTVSRLASDLLRQHISSNV